MEKTTPLTAWHQAHGATMVPFGGFLMPVQYAQGILHEHRTVRERVGLFDVSHMGELILEGPDALSNLNFWCTNRYDDLAIGAIRYGVLVRADGTSVDDLLVYRLAELRYLLVVNASNTEKDVAYLQTVLFGNVKMENVSDAWGEIALQGPNSCAVLEKLGLDVDLPYYHFRDKVLVGDRSVLLSRTGYTGEDGFELYCAASDTVALWELLLQAGADLGCEPCGLGARDTLRLEAAMPLFGHELNNDVTPLEAGLSVFVKLDKPKFIAQAALSDPPKRRRIGLVLKDRGIAREGYAVYAGERLVGRITSGTMSPSLNQAIAMALVEVDVAKELAFSVDVRGRRLNAERVKLPFYKR